MIESGELQQICDQISEEIDAVLQKIISSRLNAGQLQDSDLTLSDLRRIRAAFLSVLKSVYHPRIQYPAGIEPAQESQAATGEGAGARV